VADLYALVHRDAGPVETYLTAEEAVEAMQEVLRDEPTWWPDLWVEPFSFEVSDTPSAA